MINNKANKFKSVIENHLIWVLLILLSTFLSSIITISTVLIWTFDRVSISVSKKATDEKILNSLHAGIHISNFEKILGNPLFINTSFSKNTSLKEYIFYPKDLSVYVQALVDKNSTIVFYSVTSCGKEFTFENTPLNKPITLNKSTFSDIADPGEQEIRSYYFVSGATANSYIFESSYLGNPSRYQTTIWGMNDVCGLQFASKDLDNYLYASNVKSNIKDKEPFGMVEIFNMDYTKATIHELRKYKINTYGVTSYLTDLDDIIKYFQIGPNRVQLRTTF